LAWEFSYLGKLTNKIKFLKGLFFDILNIPIQILVTLFVIPLFIYQYGAEVYGNWISILSITSIFLFFDFGFGVPFTNEIKNGAKDKFISTIIFLMILLASIGALLFYITSNLIFGYFNLLRADSFSIHISSYIFLEITFGSFGCILSGKGYVDLVNRIKIYGEIIYISLLTIFIYLDYNILSFLYALIAKTIFNGLVLFYLSYFKLKLFYFIKKFTSKSVFLHFLKDISKYQTHRISETIYQSADNLIIQYFLGAGYVTIYNITSKIAVLFTRTIAPKFTSTLYLFIKKGTTKFFEKNYLILESKFLRLGFIFFIVSFLINEPIIKYFYSPNEFGGSTLSIIFSLWVLVEYFFINSYTHVVAFQKYNSLMYSSFFEMITNLTLSLFLVEYYGLAGVAFSTLLSKILFSYFYYYRIFMPNLKLNWLVFKFKSIFKNLIFVVGSIFISNMIFEKISSFYIVITSLSFAIIILNILIFDFKILLDNKINVSQKFKKIILE